MSSASSAFFVDHPPVRAFAFDMDGTLVDCESLNRAAVQAAAGDYCHIAWAVNAGRKEYLIHEWLKATYRKRFTIPLEEFIAACHREYAARAGQVKARDGITKALQFIQDRGLPMMVVTNTPHDLAIERLERTGLMRFFNAAAVIGSDDVTRAEKLPKPEPDPYIMAAECLGLPPHSIAGFEDSFTGFSSLVSSGLVAVHICDYGDEKQNPARYHINGRRPKQLLTVVKALCGDRKAQAKAASFLVPEPGSTPHPRGIPETGGNQRRFDSV